ncbi:MAG TPA: tryptophan synthase subunit alpha [Bacteroidales bacterium]|nr:tryptophan synthase subunit alpha [Bacteroidales bacterium]
MNKIDQLLNKKQDKLFSIYFTAGFPALESTTNIINELEKSNVDLIEIGIPFSDPVADGPVIQFSNSASIENGMTLKKLFNQLDEIKNTSKIPKILMGYFNPILKYGVEEFCKSCKNVGIDGVIIPDLPIYEYENKYQDVFKKHGIHFIFLVSPQTSLERLQQIDSLSTSFIYAVSTNSTTGGKADLNLQADYFKRLKSNLTNPFLIGFGVKDNESFSIACNYANGAIIGSAFINAISQSGDLKKNIQEFIHMIR